MLNEALEQQVLKFEVAEVAIVPIGQELTHNIAHSPEPNQKLRVLTVGSVHKGGLDLLAQTWPMLTQRYAQLELLYAGKEIAAFPASLKKVMTYCGFVTDKEEYEKILSSSHIAYLTGPSELDCFGLFSVPSRLSDFFMAGLPVVACAASGSATEKFLAPLEFDFVQLTRNETELAQGIASFVDNPATWQVASGKARAFATNHLSINVIRSIIFAKLSAAAYISKN